jgi:hypothetical protein
MPSPSSIYDGTVSVNTSGNLAVNSGQSTSELCSRCRELNLKDMESRPGSTREVYVVKNSTCPLCLFFCTALAVQDDDKVMQGPTRVKIWSRWTEGTHAQAKLIVATHDYRAPMTIPRMITVGRLADRSDSERLDAPFRVIQRNSIDFGLLQSWIKNCERYHPNSCTYHKLRGGMPATVVSGFKLIDCKTRKIVAANNLDVNYIALSYVWGSSQAISTSDGILFDNPSWSLPASLPATIEDAIIVTTQLGFQYLWVDKYCINQFNASEVRSQVQMMDTVYQAASVTIIAAAGCDSAYGLPGVQGKPRVKQNSVTVNGTSWTYAPIDWKAPVRESRWFQRAWTYQEGFFSQRRLMFTKEQVFFECDKTSFCEFVDAEASQKYHAEHSTIVGSINDVQKPMSELFTSHINLYASRDLTHQSDVLNAMKGLFRYFATKQDAWQQYWGLPVSLSSYPGHSSYIDVTTDEQQVLIAFSFGLAWISDIVLNDVSGGSSIRRLGFPSWSWAGWIGAPAWRITDLPSLDPPDTTLRRIYVQKKDGSQIILSETLAARLFLGSEDEMSSYTYNLCLEAEIFDLRVFYVDSSTMYPGIPMNKKSVYAAKAVVSLESNSPPNSRTFYWPLDVTPHVEVNDGLHSALCGQVLQCIVLSNSQGLVVLKKDGIHERVGLMKLHALVDEVVCFRDSGPHLRKHFPGSIREIVLG